MTRHGHVDWSELTPAEGVTMLAAMTAQSACSGPPAQRVTTYLGILAAVRRHFDPGKHTWTGEDIGEAVLSLAVRGALQIEPGTVRVQAWPVPGGAPW